MALDRERIVAEAVVLLDEHGLEHLTMRNLAARLDVQAPTLYWHVRNKSALVTGVADAILSDVVREMRPPSDGEPWRTWLAHMAVSLRGAMLAHRDGARVIAAAHLSVAMADLTEVAIRSLVDLGLPVREARLTVLSVEAFTLGHVLEEQAPRPDAEALEGFDTASFEAAHPTAVAAIRDYFTPGRTVDDLFADCLAIVLR